MAMRAAPALLLTLWCIISPRAFAQVQGDDQVQPSIEESIVTEEPTLTPPESPR